MRRPGPRAFPVRTPKFKVARDGIVGERNALRCGSIEHKMGIKGSATCVMNFDGAEGWLIGEEARRLQRDVHHDELRAPGLGLQGLVLPSRLPTRSLSRERLQSALAYGPEVPDKPADPIIVHPDVRRMLLSVKALTEGMRMLAMHAGSLLDDAAHAADPAERERAELLVSFLTPISKACQTEWAIENTYNALQCFGGHGYIAEHGMEQLARDARITTLYEGTTGIQAMDLIGRKTASSQAAGLKLFLAEVLAFCDTHSDDPELAGDIVTLRRKSAEWQELTGHVLRAAAGNPDELGAAAWDYLFYSGYVVLAYWWMRASVAARASSRPQAFKDAKRATARFYFARILPRTLAHAESIRGGAAPLMDLDADSFDA